MGVRLAAAAMSVLLLGACSSSGSAAAQPDDEFLDSVESLCRDAAQAIRKLDVQDPAAAGDLYDIMSKAADDLSGLRPTRRLAKVYDQYTANVDDQVSEIEALLSARAAGDVASEISAGDRIESLRSDNDGIVNRLRISSCRGLTPRRATAAVGEATGAAEPTESSTVDTSGTTPNTPLPIDDPSATGSGDTAAAATLEAYDASTAFQPIDGYTWGSLDPAGTYTPSEDAVLAPIVDRYGVGVMNPADNGSSVFVYATTLRDGVTWSSDAIERYYEFELAGDGTAVDLPTSGVSARVMKPAYDGTDVAVAVVGQQGFAIFADAGSDVAGLLDRFIVAQPG